MQPIPLKLIPKILQISDVIYRKRRILPSSKFRRSLFLRSLEDVGTKHFVLTLEATISKENGDHFQFPIENKCGCRLEMDLKFQRRSWASATEEGRGHRKSNAK